MNRNTKKGFTIVELIIVIAVIAVLAAVLIPTFSNLIQKANEAKDTALVSNLNKGLKMSSKDFPTMHEALQAVEENVGVDVEKISAVATDSKILWDSVNNCFVYLKSGDTKPTYIPDSQKTPIADNEQYKYWQIVDTAVEDTTYSQYLSGDNHTEAVTVSTGFDAGKNANLQSVTYKNDVKQSVVIRTNGGKLVVDAGNATVAHYGAANYVNIKNVYKDSYHEHGVAAVVRIEQGHFVAEATAKVINLNVTDSSVTITENEGAKVVGYSKADENVTVTVNGSIKEDVTDVKTEEQVKIEVESSAVVAEGGVAEVGGINYRTLSSAVKFATSGETIILLTDYKITFEQQFDKDLTLDLNGYILEYKGTGNAGAALSIREKTLTLVDTSSSKSGKIVSNAYGVSSEYNGTTIVDGATIESNFACLSGNNGTGNMNFTIKSGSLISKYSEAIYMPGHGILTITGGNIVGGISMRMGTLNMSGGTVSGMRKDQSADPISVYWGYSGSAWIGDAIYVMAGTYSTKFAENNNCVINITGGTVIGNAHSAVCVYDIGNNLAQKVTVTISGGATVTGQVKIDRDFTTGENYKRNYPADITVTTPTETLK